MGWLQKRIWQPLSFPPANHHSIQWMIDAIAIQNLDAVTRIFIDTPQP
jgi:hypothetical protein